MLCKRVGRVEKRDRKRSSNCDESKVTAEHRGVIVALHNACVVQGYNHPAMLRRHLALVTVAAAFSVTLFNTPDAFAQHPLPTLPGVTYSPASTPGTPAATATPQQAAPPTEAKRGLVTLEREGRLIGVGTVLNGDGRILTALSPLGGKDTVDVRYADGHVVHAKVGHKDKDWD